MISDHDYGDAPAAARGAMARQAEVFAKPARRTEARRALREMSGPQKAAVILMAVGEDRAGRIFSTMNNDEIKEVSTAMATLGTIAAPVVEELFRDFVSAFSGGGSVIGTMDGAERYLSKLLDPDRLNGIMEDLRGPAGRTIWEKLSNVNEETIASFLRTEHSQTVAVVLSKMKPDHAARVLGALPEDMANDVIRRMLVADPVKKEVLFQIEEVLRREFMATLVRTQKRDSHEVLAEIFNHFDRTTEGRFMSQLEERAKDSAERVRALMFTFDDLVRLDSAGVQVLLRAVDKDQLGLALKGAAEPVRNLIMSNMSERAARILREDVEAMGAVRLRDVEEAQVAIVALAKSLADKGELIVADRSGDDELVY